MSALASGAIGSLLPFAMKNLTLSVMRPGSFVILKSDICSVKLDHETLSLLEMVYSLISDSNHTLNRQCLKHQNSLVALRTVTLAQTPTVNAFPGTNSDHDFVSSWPVINEDEFALFLKELCIELHSWMRYLKPVLEEARENLTDDAELQAIRDLREKCMSIALHAMFVIEQCRCCSDTSALIRVLVPEMWPRRITTTDSLIPVLSKLYFGSRGLKAGSNITVLCGFIVSGLVWYDISGLSGQTQWPYVVAACALMPIPTLFNLSCFNRDLLKGISTSFQTIFLGGTSAVAVDVSLSILWRNYPLKIVYLLATTPTICIAGFLDAFPESGRAFNSHAYFTANIVGLLILMIGIVFQLYEYDEVVIAVWNWSFRVSALAT